MDLRAGVAATALAGIVLASCGGGASPQTAADSSTPSTASSAPSASPSTSPGPSASSVAPEPTADPSLPSDAPRTEPRADAGPSPSVQRVTDPGPCEDDAACESGFYLGDTFYGLGCTRVDEAQLGGVVGAGLYDVRAVEGIDPLILTAHQSPQNACNFGGYEYDGPAWRVAYGPRFDAQALCDFPHLPERQRRVNDCPVGATEAETGP